MKFTIPFDDLSAGDRVAVILDGGKATQTRVGVFVEFRRYFGHYVMVLDCHDGTKGIRTSRVQCVYSMRDEEKTDKEKRDGKGKPR